MEKEKNNMRVPYSQQFSPQQTPLVDLLGIIGKYHGHGLKKAIADKFFSEKNDPEKLAGNTLISLRFYKILDEQNNPTEFGNLLLSLKKSRSELYQALARHILLNLDGLSIIETIREMHQAGLPISLNSLPGELESRGISALKSSSDLSGVFGWLKESKLIDKSYKINEVTYASLLETDVESIDALKSLTDSQVAFLKAMVALDIQTWTPYNDIAKHAEALYSGSVVFNWKNIMKDVLQPIEKAGFIEIRKQTKKNSKTPQGRGGKSADIKPKGSFFKKISEPILDSLYKSAGFQDVRRLRSISLTDLVKEVKQNVDSHKKGLALEILAIRFCQMLDLEFDKWRETDVKITAGGEVDAMFHSSRLIYSRWQVQCKATDVAYEDIAKEVGVSQVSLANVILVVATGSATQSAVQYRKRIVSSSNLNIIIIDGNELNQIIEDRTAIVRILNSQASEAMRNKKSFIPGETETLLFSDDSATAANELRVTPSPNRRYSTEFGEMYCGDSSEVLPALIERGVRAKLIMTSPPFALIKKKEYGNHDADEYIDWFMGFIPLFKRILEPSGSLVIDIGGTWIKGLPAKSIYQYKLLMKICESGFYLAQEFYHYNPAKLPTPAEWVTIRRLRVKDAVNNVWWLVLDPNGADADNKRILKPYSSSMQNLLKNGYLPNMRPSGHDISDKFQKDNGGAIPSNLLELANTDSNGRYIRECKANGIKPHPARFPSELPEFFIKFLTQENDIVIDPFAGSNVTGEASEKLKRKWIGIEMDPRYVDGSIFRFDEVSQ